MGLQPPGGHGLSAGGTEAPWGSPPSSQCSIPHLRPVGQLWLRSSFYTGVPRRWARCPTQGLQSPSAAGRLWLRARSCALREERSSALWAGLSPHSLTRDVGPLLSPALPPFYPHREGSTSHLPPPPFIPTGVVLYFLQTRGYPPVPGENSPHGTSRPLLREAEAGRTPQRGRTNGRPSPTPQLLLTNKQHAGRGERMGGKAISSPIGSIVRPSSLPRLSRRDPLFLLVCPHVTPVDPQATPPAPPPPRLQPLRAVCKGKTAVKRAAGRGQRGGQQAARRLAAAGRSNQYGALRLARGRRGRPGSLLALGRVLSGGS